MRTPQKALTDAMPAIQAAAEGKPIEIRYSESEEWRAVLRASACAFADPHVYWRPKPEPKRTLRPWKPEEVPVGAVMRGKTINGMDRVLICAASNSDAGPQIWFLHNEGHGWNLAITCASTCEHSTDGGKTWHPCGVWEEEA